MRFLHEHITSFFLALLAGVFVAGVTVSDNGLLGLFLLSGAGMLVIVLLRHREVFAVSSLIFFCAAFGVWRFAAWDATQIPPDIVHAVGSEVVLVGHIVEEPDVREQKVNLTVRVHAQGGATTTAPFLVLVSTDVFPTYRYGEELELHGVLERPEAFASDNGRIFPYDKYLATKDIRLTVYRPDIVRTGKSDGNPVKRSLLAIKGHFQERIGSVLPDPAGALANGMLLGDKRSLGDTLIEDFRKSGIVHIVVLSGYNMTIVAEWLRIIFLFTGFWGSIGAASLGVVLFGIMAGGSATVIRAAVMALLVLLARLLGRTYDMSRALLFAGVLMVLHSPGILLYDPSFQLSFLAASGLLLFVPILKMRITLLRGSPKLEEIVLTTIATQVFVTPLLVYGSGGVSLVGLIANILVLPVIPLAMLLAFFAGLAALLGTGIGIIIALPSYLILSYIIMTGTLFAHIPLGYVTTPPISGFLVCVCYAVLLTYCMSKYRKGISPHEKARQ